ncbi:hypothetical protein [Lactiplantibacillus fabifermentans]|uniref:Cell surface protein n=2 Tax=Lactiplantibacillus fabifermentans TaxID=483011 RepID=A0A0R2NW04_9LACO|nr:hypothetical protein [Lactiplantibacillus fabifermentans]ETY72591.1 hypothetical protein LFAB_16630 [Lactiplantibacillus fabifermentans T30PCM01]KRO27997.1 hypothetical protein DY78_GL002733 [Lactiplantibacillus fabifermentans DSM 21115]
MRQLKLMLLSLILVSLGLPAPPLQAAATGQTEVGVTIVAPSPTTTAMDDQIPTGRVAQKVSAPVTPHTTTSVLRTGRLPQTNESIQWLWQWLGRGILLAGLLAIWLWWLQRQPRTKGAAQ